MWVTRASPRGVSPGRPGMKAWDSTGGKLHAGFWPRVPPVITSSGRAGSALDRRKVTVSRHARLLTRGKRRERIATLSSRGRRMFDHEYGPASCRVSARGCKRPSSFRTLAFAELLPIPIDRSESAGFLGDCTGLQGSSARSHLDRTNYRLERASCRHPLCMPAVRPRRKRAVARGTCLRQARIGRPIQRPSACLWAPSRGTG